MIDFGWNRNYVGFLNVHISILRTFLGETSKFLDALASLERDVGVTNP